MRARWLPYVALAIGLVLAGCGGGTNEATRDVARDLAYNFGQVRNCYGDDSESPTCEAAFEGIFSLCLAVGSDGVLAADDYEGADWSRFENVCDRFDQIAAMPKYLAGAEWVKLSQDARSLAE